MKILFATDGSKHAEYAEKLLLDLLKGRDGSIDLIAVSVCPTPDLHSLGFEIPTSVYETVKACREHTLQILSGVQERLWEHVDSLEKHVLDGHPSHQILNMVDELKPDLCLVGSHGWTFSERIFLGSVSDQLAKHATCSVLIARPQDNQFEQVNCKRILVADDGSEGATNALRRLESLPSTKGRIVRLVSVVQDSFPLDAMIPEQAAEILVQRKQAATERLERDAAELQSLTSETDFQVRVGASVPKELLKAATEFEADLILVGGKPKPLLQRAFLGSVALSVLHHADCPVWIER